MELNEKRLQPNEWANGRLKEKPIRIYLRFNYCKISIRIDSSKHSTLTIIIHFMVLFVEFKYFSVVLSICLVDNDESKAKRKRR